MYPLIKRLNWSWSQSCLENEGVESSRLSDASVGLGANIAICDDHGVELSVDVPAYISQALANVIDSSVVDASCFTDDCRRVLRVLQENKNLNHEIKAFQV